MSRGGTICLNVWPYKFKTVTFIFNKYFLSFWLHFCPGSICWKLDWVWLVFSKYDHSQNVTDLFRQTKLCMTINGLLKIPRREDKTFNNLSVEWHDFTSFLASPIMFQCLLEIKLYFFFLSNYMSNNSFP